MARLDRDQFPGPLDLVYIAGNVTDAETAERTLTAEGIDYALSMEEFSHGSVLGSILGGVYKGLFVFVGPLHYRRAADILEAAGLTDVVALTQEERSHEDYGT